MLELNKIYNRDCLEGMREIEDGSIDLVLTDPPYEIGAKGCGLAGDRQYLKDITINKLDKGFNITTLKDYLRVLRKANIITFCSKNQLGNYINWIENKILSWVLITWHKRNPTPLLNNNYLPDTEYIFHIWKDKKLSGNYETKKRYYITNVIKNPYNHPTVKPLHIIRNLIINSTDKGDTVLDPFMGSGTTAVACEQIGRKWIGFEISKEYCDIANKWLEKYRGQTKLEEWF